MASWTVGTLSRTTTRLKAFRRSSYKTSKSVSDPTPLRRSESEISLFSLSAELHSTLSDSPNVVAEVVERSRLASRRIIFTSRDLGTSSSKRTNRTETGFSLAQRCEMPMPQCQYLLLASCHDQCWLFKSSSGLLSPRYGLVSPIRKVSNLILQLRCSCQPSPTSTTTTEMISRSFDAQTRDSNKIPSTVHPSPPFLRRLSRSNYPSLNMVNTVAEPSSLSSPLEVHSSSLFSKISEWSFMEERLFPPWAVQSISELMRLTTIRKESFFNSYPRRSS